MNPAAAGENDRVIGDDDARRAVELFAGLLRRTHLSNPSDIAAVLADEFASVGVEDAAFYLADYEQVHLVPIPVAGRPERPAPPIDASLAGRAYTTTSAVTAAADDPGRRRVWLPLLDGTDRFGVVEVTVPAPGGEVTPALLALCERYAHLAALVIATKSLYGDVFERVRRSRPMSIAGELQWKLVPPSTYSTERLVISAFMEPCYDVGGDSYDYAVNGEVAHLAVFDAMGHGLGAAGLAAFAVSAYRHSRRTGQDLPQTYAAINAAVGENFGGGEGYVTGLLGQLHLGTGRFRWISAGHPAPLLLRGGRLVKTLEAAPATPLGLPFITSEAAVAEESLEPGDRLLLFTDGLPEARLPDGEFFGTERLGEFIEREAAAGRSAPETLRRLRRSILAHQHGQLQDDATGVLVEWNRGSEFDLLPQTV
ncbi:MAG: serine/threonine-protein phosphatase [Actinomycetota bacterium]|nr:serine/threonine-protein phosphatase [Actinomycetota bacterium]